MQQYRPGQRRSLRSGLAALALLGAVGLVAGSGAPAAAQQVVGEVRDASGRAVGQAYIGLLDEEQELVAATLARDDGSFVLTAPGPGWFYLTIRQIGYRTLFDGLYELREGRRLEIEAVMHPMAVALDSLEVSVRGEVSRLEMVGFYERQDRGFGHFMVREEIMATGGRYLAHALQRLPRVTVLEPRPSLGRFDGLQNPELYIRSGGQRCDPAFYLDGVRTATLGGPLRPDDFVDIEHVEAVEVYTGMSQAPLQYSEPGACAVVLVWTHHTPPIR